MRGRSVAMLLVLPALAAGLVGCQQDGSGGSLRGQAIEVIAIWSGGEQASFIEVLGLFGRQTGADVRYVAGGDDLSTLIQTRVNGGNPPNVAISPHPGVVKQLAGNGALKPLPPSVAELVMNRYSSTWLELGTANDGRLYSVFFKANHKSTFWYNERTLTDNGLAPPTDWPDFIELCTELADLGVSPVAVGGADGWVLTDWFENVYLQIHGPDRYDELSRHDILWTHPSVRKAFEKLGEFFGQDMFIHGGSAGALQSNFEDSVIDVFGPQARAAMVYEGDFVASVVNDETESVVGGDAKFVSFPRIGPDSGKTRVVVGGDAAVAFKDDPATIEFMKFLAGPEAAEVWAGQGGFLSPNNQVSLDVYPDDLTRAMAEQMVGAGADVRFDMSDLYQGQFGATMATGARKAMQDFLDNPDDIDRVMRQLEDAATKAGS